MPDDHPLSKPATALIAFTALFAPILVIAIWGGDPLELSKVSSREESLGRVAMVAAPAVCAVMAHLRIRRWFLACTVSAGSFVFLCALAGFMGSHHPSAFSLLGLLTLFVFGFAVASVVGVLFFIVRACRRPGSIR